jgi:hypothetical protein
MNNKEEREWEGGTRREVESVTNLSDPNAEGAALLFSTFSLLLCRPLAGLGPALVARALFIVNLGWPQQPCVGGK